MADVVLFGVGQMAEVAKSYLEWEGTHKVVAFAVSASYRTEASKQGLPVVAWETIEQTHPPGEVRLFCPISYRDVNTRRKDFFLQGLAKGYEFISFIHPRAHYYGTPVGRNCFILEANVIQPHVTIADNCILWSGNHIGHHSHVGSHCFISSHVVISGSVQIGERCFLGVNSTIRDNVQIGSASVIGAGALVTSDVAENSVIPGSKSEPIGLQSSELKGI